GSGPAWAWTTLRRPRRSQRTGAGATARCAAGTTPTGPGTSGPPPGPPTVRSGSDRSTPTLASLPRQPPGANGGAPNWPRGPAAWTPWFGPHPARLTCTPPAAALPTLWRAPIAAPPAPRRKLPVPSNFAAAG